MAGAWYLFERCLVLHVCGTTCLTDAWQSLFSSNYHRSVKQSSMYLTSQLVRWFPCRQAVPISTTLPTPAAQGKCSTVFPLNFHWPALHFYEEVFALHVHFYLIWANLKTAHFECGIRPKEGDTQASAKEAGNKPFLSAALHLCYLPTWVALHYLWND